MLRHDADMRRKGQEPLHPEPHAVFSLIQAAARRFNVEKASRRSSGQGPAQYSIQHPDRYLFSYRPSVRERGSRDVWQVSRYYLWHGTEASDSELHVWRISLLRSIRACALVDQERPTTGCCRAVLSKCRLNHPRRQGWPEIIPAIPVRLYLHKVNPISGLQCAAKLPPPVQTVRT